MKKRQSRLRAWRMPPEERAKMVAEYVAGATCTAVGERYGVTDSFVMSCVRRAGATPRTMWQTRGLKWTGEKLEAVIRDYRSGLSQRDISEKHGIAEAYIWRVCKTRGCARTGVRYQYDPSAFSRDDEATAYWLGFLITDGCLHDNKASTRCGTRTLSLKLQDRDTDHVRLFQRFMQTTAPVKYVHDRSPQGEVRRYADIRICLQPETVKRLIAYGVTPRKTLTCRINHLAQNRHFWRGVIDGDGSLKLAQQPSGKYRFTIELASASPGFIEQFSRFCREVSGSPPRVYARAGLAKSACIDDDPALRLLRHLYHDATVALKRKAVTARLVLAAPQDVFIGDYSRSA
jgi:hypothetical protein